MADRFSEARSLELTTHSRDFARVSRSILYLLAVFAAGTLVPRDELKAQMDHLIPADPSTPKNDAPWASSPFLTALAKAGSSYNWVGLFTLRSPNLLQCIV